MENTGRPPAPRGAHSGSRRGATHRWARSSARTHQIFGGRREDLGRRKAVLEMNFHAAAAAGDREHRAVGDLVIGIVKRLVAQWLLARGL